MKDFRLTWNRGSCYKSFKNYFMMENELQKKKFRMGDRRQRLRCKKKSLKDFLFQHGTTPKNFQNFVAAKRFF